MPMEWHQRQSSGELVGKVNNGVGKVVQTAEGLSRELVPALIQTAFSLVPLLLVQRGNDACPAGRARHLSLAHVSRTASGSPSPRRRYQQLQPRFRAVHRERPGHPGRRAVRAGGPGAPQVPPRAAADHRARTGRGAHRQPLRIPAQPGALDRQARLPGRLDLAVSPQRARRGHDHVPEHADRAVAGLLRRLCVAARAHLRRHRADPRPGQADEREARDRRRRRGGAGRADAAGRRANEERALRLSAAQRRGAARLPPDHRSRARCSASSAARARARPPFRT